MHNWLSLNNAKFQQYMFNTSWMLFERLLRIIAGLFVGIYVARYLGPENFGVLSYVLAIASIVAGLVGLGMNSILVRELVNLPEKKRVVMGTAFWMMMVASIVSYCFTVVLIWGVNENDSIILYTTIILFSILFIPFWVFDYYFQSEVQAKFSSICRSSSLLVVSLVKVYLVLVEEELVWFVIASVIENVVLAASLFLIYTAKKKDLLFFFTFDVHEAKALLKSAWPMCGI